MILGIDASNLRQGGGLTHLRELLRHASPEDHGFERVVVWGSANTLDLLAARTWLVPRNRPALQRSLPYRLAWQRFELQHTANAEGCDVLFTPGGLVTSKFGPVVTMSRNALPFEAMESARYGFSGVRLRTWLLRQGQQRSLQHADGVIFLTEYARRTVGSIAKPRGHVRVIPHGIASRFRYGERPPPRPLSDYTDGNPLEILYVSIIDVYKHQWNVARAIHLLREEGLPLRLTLIGPSYPPAMALLEETLNEIDPAREFVHYLGAVPFEVIHAHYANADAFCFASSCENMPNILLEAMAAGCPIASSDRGPMPEVLGNAGVYFDPERPESIADALRDLVHDPDRMRTLGEEARVRSSRFSWQTCATETFQFLAEVARR